jgi:hypothetical protein
VTVSEPLRKHVRRCDAESEKVLAVDLGVDPRYVEAHPRNPDAKLTIVIGIEDKDAERLQQLAAERHQRPGEVISSLLRSA